MLWTPANDVGVLGRTEVLHVAYHETGDIQFAVEAVSVSECESMFDTTAVGPYGHRGLWQVSEHFWGPVPKSAYGQAKQAHQIWLEHGWDPWSCKP
jgi:hypothetical protein